MRRFLLLLTVLALLLGLTACTADEILSIAEELYTDEVTVLDAEEEEPQPEEEEPEEEPEEALFPDAPEAETLTSGTTLEEDGLYYQKDEVALYIYTYGDLPDNFITKKEAQALGWQGGKLEPFAAGKSIGGDRFGNYEGQLPKKKGRSYTECDIDTYNKKRGKKRIVFSNDGLIYYTNNHYKTFELLYGEP